MAWCGRLGIDLEALDAVRVRGVALRTPGGALVRGIARSGARAPAEAALVPRLRFDAALVEMAVADAVNGRVVRNRDSIANPEAVDLIAAHPLLKFVP